MRDGDSKSYGKKGSRIRLGVMKFQQDSTGGSMKRILVTTVGLFLCSSFNAFAADADAAKVKWLAEKFESLVQKVDDGTYLSDNSNGKGRQVLTLLNGNQKKWPFRTDLFNAKNSTAVGGMYETAWPSPLLGISRNEVQYKVVFSNSTPMLVSVIFYFRRSEGNSLRFEDIFIHNIGQQKVNIFLSEVINDWKNVREKLVKAVPNDLQIYAGLLAMRENSPTAPSPETLIQLASTPEKVAAIKDVVFLLSQAEKFRQTSSKERRSSAESFFDKYNAKGDVSAGHELKADDITLYESYRANADFLQEAETKSSSQSSAERIRDVAYLDKEQQKQLNDAFKTLKTSSEMPPELDWFFDVKKLMGN